MSVAFDEVVEKITIATSSVEGDKGASPVLIATVREFRAKLKKAQAQATDGVPYCVSVIELEQAGDSAKAGAEADPGLSHDARESVLAAHLAYSEVEGRRLTTLRLQPERPFPASSAPSAAVRLAWSPVCAPGCRSHRRARVLAWMIDPVLGLLAGGGGGG